MDSYHVTQSLLDSLQEADKNVKSEISLAKQLQGVDSTASSDQILSQIKDKFVKSSVQTRISLAASCYELLAEVIPRVDDDETVEKIVDSCIQVLFHLWILQVTLVGHGITRYTYEKECRCLFRSTESKNGSRKSLEFY